MTFKAQITTPVYADPKNPIDTSLEFTKTRVKFPDTLIGNPFQERDIKNNARYSLIISDSLHKRERYEIKLGTGKSFHLIVDKANERKLKWIHHLYWIQKNLFGIITLIISILTVLAKILF